MQIELDALTLMRYRFLNSSVQRRAGMDSKSLLGRLNAFSVIHHSFLPIGEFVIAFHHNFNRLV